MNQPTRFPAAAHARSQGFTLIEILIVIGLIAILASIVLIAVNPSRQFAQARNTQRVSNVNAILNAIGARAADTKGTFTDSNACVDTLPTNATQIASGQGYYDLRPCLVPVYISELPFDPESGENTCTTDACIGAEEHYRLGYTIAQAENGRVTICAPEYGEPALGLSPDEQYCLTR